MGVCYFKLKNTIKARECFARVLELDPASAGGLLGLAVIDLNDNDMEQAFGRLKQVRVCV
jgi:hypothetical protein